MGDFPDIYFSKNWLLLVLPQTLPAHINSPPTVHHQFSRKYPHNLIFFKKIVTFAQMKHYVNIALKSVLLSSTPFVHFSLCLCVTVRKDHDGEGRKGEGERVNDSDTQTCVHHQTCVHLLDMCFCIWIGFILEVELFN